MHFRILPDHQNQVLKKDMFLTSGVVKNVFWCICAYFQTTRNFKKKDIYDSLKWLKTCFDAFSHTSRPPETFVQKRYFLPSGVVKNVFLCICAYFLPDHQKRFFKKIYYWTSRVVKNVFWCICAYFETTRNFFSKKIFLTVWSG